MGKKEEEKKKREEDEKILEKEGRKQANRDGDIYDDCVINMIKKKIFDNVEIVEKMKEIRDEEEKMKEKEEEEAAAFNAELIPEGISPESLSVPLPLSILQSLSSS